MRQSDVATGQKRVQDMKAAVSVPLWASTKTSPYVSEFAEGLLREQLLLSSKYAYARISDTTFYCLLATDAEKDSVSPVPR